MQWTQPLRINFYLMAIKDFCFKLVQQYASNWIILKFI